MHYYMLNKPGGCVSARRDARHKTVLDYFPEELRDVIFPVGRLDRDTEGLLILTDDGALNARLLNPDSNIEKEYFFYAVGEPDGERLSEIFSGIKLYPTKDIMSRPALIFIDGECTLADVRDKLSPFDMKRANKRPDTPVFYGRVIVTEGKKHEVKRMLLYTGARIIYLKRIAMGGLSLDASLSPGQYRPLADCELEVLKIK